MSPERIRMLLVEDDRVDQMAFERMVRKERLPYDYTCVQSVAEGRKAIEENDYDIVVADYRLGDGTGFDLIIEAPPDLPMILVTGAGGEEVAVKALKAGAADYLMKDRAGAYLKTLPITVTNALKTKAAERELKKYHQELEKLVEERTLLLKHKNEELSRENEERKKIEEALRAAHDRLELRVQERTAELRERNEELRTQIGERKKAENDLQRSKETVEALLNATSDCAFLLETDGTFAALNQRTEETLDPGVGPPIGRSYFEVIPKEVRPIRKAKFEDVIRTRKAVRFEDTHNGQVLDHSYHPVFDSDGSVEKIAVFSREVTDQKKAQEVSVQKERLAALGEMAGGVAHNFNNLLQMVIGAAGLAEADLDGGDIDEVKAVITQISDSAQLGSETVKQLQDFARVRTEDPTVDGQVFDLADTCRRALDVSRPFWKSGPAKRGVRLEMDARIDEGCLVKGHRNELFEVIVNLVKNATEAMPEGGKIQIRLYKKDGQVRLKVADSGMGIPEENLPKVFEPFWTTKGVQGTGMGLSTSFGIISRHGGLITVKSKEGKGAVFTIKLPFAGEAAEDGVETPESSTDPFRTRILLVEEQPLVADSMERGLKQLGQKVYCALSSKKALELFLTKRPDVVVCDVDMPVMDGWKLAKVIKDACRRKGRPETPFVLLTGTGLAEEDRERMTECGVGLILEKPLKYTDLLEAVRGLLGDERSKSENREQAAG